MSAVTEKEIEVAFNTVRSARDRMERELHSEAAIFLTFYLQGAGAEKSNEHNFLMHKGIGLFFEKFGLLLTEEEKSALHVAQEIYSRGY